METTSAEANAQQFGDLEGQSSGIVKFAHLCAGLLLLAGSLGSLISISYQAFIHFWMELHAGRFDLPNLINVAVGVLIVLAGDSAMLVAARMLRALRSAQAPFSEMWLHVVVMGGVSLLEAGTFLYMAWLFDRPTTFVLWSIDIGRALAWPGLCAYLSLARRIPVGPRDVAYQASLAAGNGVIRDVTRLAGDPSAPLERKVRIYSAAARMSMQDRAQFAGIIDAVSEAPAESRPVTPPTPRGGLPIAPATPDGGNGSPEGLPEPTPLRMVSGARASLHKTRGRLSRNEQLRTQAFALLDKQPTLPKTELRKALRTRQETANALHSAWTHSRRARA